MTPGLSGAFGSWRSALSRCVDPTNGQYKDYGGRGITMCERWLDYRNFLADMGERPSGLSLDRINNNGGYEPGNCRWATRAQQARNTRRNVLINGVHQVDVARAAGLADGTVMRRLKAGREVSAPAFTYLARKVTDQMRSFVADRPNEKQIVLARQLGVSHTTIQNIRAALLARDHLAQMQNVDQLERMDDE